MAIEKDHPRPRTEHEPGRCPPPCQLSASQREHLKDPQRASDANPGVTGKIENRHRLIHIPPGLRGDNNPRHSGQLVERRAFATSGLRKSLLRPFPGSWDRIEDLNDARSIRVGIIKRG